MLNTLVDFVPLTVVIFFSFAGIAIFETIVIKAFKRLEPPKNLFFSLAANGAGFLITFFVGVILIFAFLAFFSTALGGALFLMVISLIVLVVLIAIIPILTCSARFILLKLFGVTEETRFRFIYSVVSTLGVIAAIFVLQFLISMVIFYIFPDFAV
ncbi:MAG: hypothetical protein HKN25_05495 [Pyrinomonadaceae bacterium]|nr:hypothetical protein [Pyrinomonadaceae bacterium]